MTEARLSQSALFAKLLSLDLPPDDFAVFGSGPMFIHGLREAVHDLDVVARGRAWQAVSDLAEVVRPDSGVGRKVVLFDGDIEVYDAWAPGEWDVAQLIESSEVCGGIRFVELRHVAAWKTKMGRPKDLVDAQRIDTYLGRGLDPD